MDGGGTLPRESRCWGPPRRQSGEIAMAWKDRSSKAPTVAQVLLLKMDLEVAIRPQLPLYKAMWVLSPLRFPEDESREFRSLRLGPLEGYKQN